MTGNLDRTLSYEDLAKDLRRCLAKLRKRRAAVQNDLARINDSEEAAKVAPWLIPAAARAPRGSTSLSFTDYSGETPTLRSFPLDPAKPPKEQVDALFQRARRLRGGLAVASSRLALVDEEIRIAESLVSEMDAPEFVRDEASVFAVNERFRMRFGQQILKERERRLSSDRKLPYRVFASRTGTAIWVGRDAKRNDQLTQKVAKPHHIWLHAKSVQGAHVVLAVEKGAELASDLLVDGAHLAAHFSSARGEDVVDVSYVERRYVRKPRKSPPGLVVLDREKVISIRVEPALLAKLLASEKHEALVRPIR